VGVLDSVVLGAVLVLCVVLVVLGDASSLLSDVAEGPDIAEGENNYQPHPDIYSNGQRGYPRIIFATPLWTGLTFVVCAAMTEVNVVCAAIAEVNVVCAAIAEVNVV
jgi:hypothetical protein